jgi:exodeoxyribonuclease VII small subunit
MNGSPNNDLTFEQALTELEQVVRDLEGGQLGLEEALSRYEAGVGLLKRCFTELRTAEQRILLLTGIDADGQAICEPFEHSATAEVTKAEAKPRHKKESGPEVLF